MNQPMNMMGGSPEMMAQYPEQAQYFPQGGFVTLDPTYYPGQVTLDPGNPYHSYHGMDNMHSMHHQNPCCPRPCPPPCPPPAPEPITYVVRQGDSVYLIAQRFGTTMQAIILANNLSNPDLIFPGQVLYIPVV
ncbi:LysM domain-containing protein [Desulfitobacterium dichloroeliminans LMG P-21439]|uniref:LysM domain-containing protein n=1 Tax=Desulfitobacterium dichloroeliminans (strain LMG P-21439 / DCA1) TaxID=871963 RepID=L0F8V9_DESDL|nr:LysM domain-containing protein [Desulfitobacterium dichloroeliminans]AGA69393.1 LysM domain-containing protein [Desulfitobacterium dichloroeliminans LMG P-21439]